jgi:dTDP-4-amino-4,6-dideoxygalactose transaminase
MHIPRIPFTDLHAQYLTIREEVDAAIATVIRDSAYIGGRVVSDFEAAFARYLGLEHVVSCANGTDSMEIILKAWGIGPGDEVIVPAHSWISTSEAVGNVGARPVFVDVEPQHYTLDVGGIERAITPRTRAIIPVHLYGHPADMPAIMAIAGHHGLKVLEDCAQAHGATVGGRLAGTFGHAASFSFYPGKNLGAYGDAGCMATDDPDLALRIRRIANHGQQGKHNNLTEGRNSRLDGLQAAILSAKLPHLDGWNRARNAVAAAYTEGLRGLPLDTPAVRSGCSHVFHLYVIRTDRRDELMQQLRQAGVEAAVHYPTALPFLPCYHTLGHNPSDFPTAFANQSRILSLPIFPEMTGDMTARVLNVIHDLHHVPIPG